MARQHRQGDPKVLELPQALQRAKTRPAFPLPNPPLHGRPPEIRLQIYNNLLLLPPAPFDLWSAHHSSPAGRSWRHYANHSKRRLHVLRLNKPINVEAAELFYGRNEFRFTRANAAIVLHAFLRTIGDGKTRAGCGRSTGGTVAGACTRPPSRRRAGGRGGWWTGRAGARSGKCAWFCRVASMWDEAIVLTCLTSWTG